jgi:hypothetical protein
MTQISFRSVLDKFYKTFLFCNQGSLTEGGGSVLLTSLYLLVAHFYTRNIIYLFTKQVTLMRRSTVLSLPSWLVFPTVSYTLAQLALASISILV